MFRAGGHYAPDAMLRLGDDARRSPPVSWAVDAVATAWPDLGPECIRAWPLGQLDNALVALRETHFGHIWRSEPVCCHCHASFDLVFNPTEMGFGLARDWSPGDLPTTDADFGDGPVTLRPLIVHDMLTIERCGTEMEAQHYLLSAFGVAERSLETALELAANLDPLANIWMITQCPECAADQSLLFDPARFLAEEIARGADLLLGEVADLAAFYHWSEADILTLPAARRRFYLSRIA